MESRPRCGAAPSHPIPRARSRKRSAELRSIPSPAGCNLGDGVRQPLGQVEPLRETQTREERGYPAS